MTFEIEDEFGDVLHAYADAKNDGETYYADAYDRSRSALTGVFSLLDEETFDDVAKD